jgi:hypothetical protein
LTYSHRKFDNNKKLIFYRKDEIFYPQIFLFFDSGTDGTIDNIFLKIFQSTCQNNVEYNLFYYLKCPKTVANQKVVAMNQKVVTIN